MAGQRLRGKLGPHAATAMVVVALCLFCAGAARRGVVVTNRNTTLGPNDVMLKADGTVIFSNGSKVSSWWLKKVEMRLEKDAFTCLNGVIFGIQLPELGPSPAIFSYVKPARIQKWHPMHVYVDIADMRRVYFVCPPVDGWSAGWRLMYRRASEMHWKSEWAEERLFTLGATHPCEPEGDLGVDEAAAALNRVKQAAAAVTAKLNAEADEEAAAPRRSAEAAGEAASDTDEPRAGDTMASEAAPGGAGADGANAPDPVPLGRLLWGRALAPVALESLE